MVVWVQRGEGRTATTTATLQHTASRSTCPSFWLPPRADIALTASLPATEAHRTWSGALHSALAALVWRDGGAALHTRAMTDFWRVEGLGLMQLWPRSVAETICLTCRGLPPAWEAAIERRWEAAPLSTARTLSVRAQYREHFALEGDEHKPEPAFPDRMPWYFRHTSRFATLAHARDGCLCAAGWGAARDGRQARACGRRLHV
jgi:hypothetical protein